MGHRRSNVLRKEDVEMATPVQELTSVVRPNGTNGNGMGVSVAIQHHPPRVKGKVELVLQYLRANRAIAPLSLLAFLLLVFLLSPLLPIGVREYISALIR